MDVGLLPQRVRAPYKLLDKCTEQFKKHYKAISLVLLCITYTYVCVLELTVCSNRTWVRLNGENHRLAQTKSSGFQLVVEQTLKRF